MGSVIALGYLGVTGPIDEWKTFGRDVLGIQEVPSSSDDTVRFRVDGRTWRLSVREGPGGLDFVGWEVRNQAALDQLTAALDAAKVSWKENPELAADRQVRTLIQCDDPDGNALEFYVGGPAETGAFVSPTGARFVAGEFGLGHLVMMVGDAAASSAFYLDTLGFALSDTLATPFGEVKFTHVNGRHHSMAFGAPGFFVGLNHFMLEVDDFDVVGRAIDAAQGAGFEIGSALGRHSNDHMLSFYVKSPSGFEIEYGYGGRIIDDDHWTPDLYTDATFWGHKRSKPFGT